MGNEMVIFDRKTAFEKGFRDSMDISKDSFKRPYVLIRKWRKNLLFSPKGTISKSEWINIVSRNKKNKKLLENIYNEKTLIDVADLEKHENLKNRTIAVYVEKYSDNIYTVREDRYDNSQVTAELYCEYFFDIVGKFEIINLDKNNGQYFFKYIIDSYGLLTK